MATATTVVTATAAAIAATAGRTAPIPVPVRAVTREPAPARQAARRDRPRWSRTMSAYRCPVPLIVRTCVR
ncbi:hypothetical protein BX257_8000 [Streptomyces sp. 3212.3]|nr:hypothetical protein BX257_8000 [Streptomyces sp. 3212.3]